MDALDLLLEAGLPTRMLSFATEAVQRSIMFCHLKSLSDRDLRTVPYEVEDSQTKFILDIPQHFDRMLKISSVSNCVEASPLDSLSFLDKNTYAVVGQELYVNFVKGVKTFEVSYYQAPKIHPLIATDSWIYKEYPYVIASHAIRSVARKLNSHIPIVKGESEVIFDEEFATMLRQEKIKHHGTY